MATENLVRRRLATIERKALAALAEAGMKPNEIECVRGGMFPQLRLLERDVSDRVRKRDLRIRALIIAAQSAQAAAHALDQGDMFRAMDKLMNAVLFTLGPDSEIGAKQIKAAKDGGYGREDALTAHARRVAATLPKDMKQRQKARHLQNETGINFNTALSMLKRVGG